MSAIPKILILGRPNVGKSTLFNYWVGHRLAIESDIAGTARDFITHRVEFGGQSAWLVDTAGFEDATSDHLLQLALKKTRTEIATADVILFLVSAADGVQPLDIQIARLVQKSGRPFVLAATKADNSARQQTAKQDFFQLGLDEPLPISVKQSVNLDELERQLLEKIAELPKPNSRPHVVILHGQESCEKPNRRAPQNEDHWLGWLKQELEKRGYRVDNPLISREWEAGYADWTKIIDKLKIAEQSILVGHSAGAAFWSRWLAENHQKVKKLFLIAPAKIINRELQGKNPAHLDLMDFDFDPDLSKMITGGTTIFISDNDKPHRLEAAKMYREALKAKQILLPSRGHFTWKENPLNNEFPELRDAILAENNPPKPLRLALLGRPNVGKSTLLNQLLGQERALVSDIAGTTRDLVEVEIEHDGRQFAIIDTAGLRRPGKRQHTLEFYSTDRTRKAIDHADVVGILLDAREGLCKQDLALGSQVVEAGRALFFIANKWDLLDTEEKTWLQNNLPAALQNFAEAEVVAISAQTGLRATQILETAQKLAAKMNLQVKTSQLNHLLENEPSVIFASQVGTNPPHFSVQIRGSRQPHFSVRRRIANLLRREIDLRGIPVRFSWRPKQKWQQAREKLTK